jgi:DNA-binding PadR family transcriptional regulator
MSAPAPASDLEGVVLGIVHKFGPCTAYALRKHFEGSPTRFFTSSTGAIYPAVRRLERAGLLASRADRRGRQRRRQLELTPAGKSALRAWLGPPVEDGAFGTPYDPLRTRMYFIEALPPGRRRAFLDALRRGLERQLEEVESYVASFDPASNRAGHLAARGCLHATRAQLRWLDEVAREL